MNDVVITYICDRKACSNCKYPECHDTVDIRHAVNFESFSIGTRDYFAEKDPDGDFLSHLLTTEAIKFVNRYPMIINDLANKHNDFIDISLEQTKEY